MDIKNAKINFLGDSITFGCGTSCIEKGFVKLIENKTGAVCRNYGISATRIARQSADKFKGNSYCERFDEMDNDANCIIVFGGTNDFGHGDAPLGKFEDRTDSTFYGALHFLFEGLINKYPTAKIGVLTPLHRCNEDNPRGDGGKPTDVAVLSVYVDIIKEVARYYSLPVLDLFACSGIQPRVPVQRQLYMPDGLHPNDAGNEILCEKIIRFIDTL